MGCQKTAAMHVRLKAAIMASILMNATSSKLFITILIILVEMKPRTDEESSTRLRSGQSIRPCLGTLSFKLKLGVIIDYAVRSPCLPLKNTPPQD